MRRTVRVDGRHSATADILNTSKVAVTGVGTNVGVVVGEARPEGPRAGGRVLGEGGSQPAPPHQLVGLWERCGVMGRAPATEGFSYILCRQIAFPSISVPVAYSLHG